MRIEHDLLGQMKVPREAYYGIHSLRAKHNFELSGRMLNRELIKALAVVKSACAKANCKAGNLEEKISQAICVACEEVQSGKFDEWFIVDALQGGAGTSANMNANEVIANRAIEVLGGQKGDYSIVNPLDHVNRSQSTNDVFPTAVKIAAIRRLRELSESLAKLQESLQRKEEEFHDVLKVGRTQMQDAVPILLGQEFGAWAQAISRDRWRLYKAEERLRVVNIGGTAVGTGLNAEKKYIFSVIEKLRELTGLGLARSELMMDTTQNCDVFVEVSGLIKTCAVNLNKIASDIRLLSSGPRAGIGELIIPSLQAGSSIMPGKVNPVVLEATQQIAFKIFGDDVTITYAAANGQLELNAFMPLIANCILEMLELMRNGVDMLREKCIDNVACNRDRCAELVENSFVLVTALVPHIGYENATRIITRCLNENITVREVLGEEQLLSDKMIKEILNPIKMTSPGIVGK